MANRVLVTVEDGNRVVVRSPGPQGPVTDITVGTVETLNPGDPAYLEITGDAPHLVLNGGIPRGETGSPLNLIDAKGDLLVGSANDTVARVAVGANGTLLVADSTAAAGVAWRAPSPITASAIGVTLDRANPVYSFTSGSVTATLPAASTHTGVRFLVRNAGSGTITVSGITGLTIPGTGYVDVVSDGSAWVVLEGAYATSAVGLASYRWNQANAAWRLIGYDSGVRNVTADMAAAFQTSNPNAVLYLRRTLDRVTCKFSESAAGSAGTKTIYTLPTGFGVNVPGSVAVATINDATGAIANEALYLAGGVLYGFGWTAIRHAVEMSWSATQATLPTSLPGTQASAPV